MSSVNDNNRKIRDVRDIWGCNHNKDVAVDSNRDSARVAPAAAENNVDNRTKHKYKTLERHLSMKKTIRKKMMRDLREIGGDADVEANSPNTHQTAGFLEQIKNDQPPPPNIDKPSLWKRLTKGWGHS